MGALITDAALGLPLEEHLNTIFSVAPNGSELCQDHKIGLRPWSCQWVAYNIDKKTDTRQITREQRRVQWGAENVQRRGWLLSGGHRSVHVQVQGRVELGLS